MEPDSGAQGIAMGSHDQQMAPFLAVPFYNLQHVGGPRINGSPKAPLPHPGMGCPMEAGMALQRQGTIICLGQDELLAPGGL